MDPSIIGNVDSLYALLGLGIVAITVLILDQRRRADRGPAVQAASVSEGEPSSNGKRPSEKDVRLLMAQNCQECKQVQDIKTQIAELRTEYKRDFAGLERNVSEHIRGVHERLDRVIERRAV